MLRNQTILITGGSSGIGFQLAKVLSPLNTVLICGRSKEKLLKAKAMLPNVQIFQCDLAKEEECINLVRWVSENFPSCNYLINNAAIVNRDLFLEDDTLHRANEEFQINLMAPIRLSKLLLPMLMQNRQGTLINVSTGLIYAPKAAYTFYNSTKAALHSFTQVLRIQLKNQPIRIVEVMFPAVDTPWHDGTPPKIAISSERAVDQMLKGLAAGKTEIKVGGVAVLYWLARIAPSFAIKKINSL